MAINLTGPVTLGTRLAILATCGLGICVLTLVERQMGPAIPLGGFFLLPLAVAAAFLSRWSIFVLAIATAVLRESAGAFSDTPQFLQRLTLSTVAFAGGGLFAGELVRNRRMAIELLRKTHEEIGVREEAERETRALVESSPAGVLTVDSEGKIGMANAAARRLLGFTEKDSPEGEPVERYIPLLTRLLESKRVAALTQTMVEARGQRRNGDAFFSQAWVSAYDTAAGKSLAVIMMDITEQTRDREESGLQQLLSNSRIVAGAVSHELRNLAAAASVLHLNLTKNGQLSSNADFQALGSVIQSILGLASTELAGASEDENEGLDLVDLLAELRTIISPSFEEAAVTAEWDIQEGLPEVRASHTGLLQVFLNLTKNACAALRGRPGAKIVIAAYQLSGAVVIRFRDNGPGIPSAERLFQPFQPGASSTGLGLFVSRAVIRTFGGELHHTQFPGECSFLIELPALVAHE